MRKALIIWLSALIVSSAVYAVTTRYIEISTLDDFLAGKSEWVEISALGKIRPGQAFKKYMLGEQQVWSILPHSSGRYFVGTGLRGRVLMFDGKKVGTVLETESVIVSSLVEGRGGKVYASLPVGRFTSSTRTVPAGKNSASSKTSTSGRWRRARTARYTPVPARRG